MESSTIFPVAAEKITVASVYARLGKKGRAYLDGCVTEERIDFMDATRLLRRVPSKEYDFMKK